MIPSDRISYMPVSYITYHYQVRLKDMIVLKYEDNKNKPYHIKDVVYILLLNTLVQTPNIDFDSTFTE